MGFTFEASGDYACFTRPELKVERVSYDVITPSAARGIIEAVFWKPEIRYLIDKIEVINPIKFDKIRQNEFESEQGTLIESKQSPLAKYISSNGDRTQSAATILKDVRYVITAHFEMTGKATKPDATEDKYINIINRRLKKGQCFHTPYLGTSEFYATVKLIEKIEDKPQPINVTQDFGFMLYDMEFDLSEGYSAIPTFFRAKMENGVIDLEKARKVGLLK